MSDLVLSLFPGIGLLDMAFEAAGFCVVRGPDLLWGGDIKRFRPPTGRFGGVIGGPPCQHWSRLSHIVRAVHGPDAVAPDLIPEFARCVLEAQPTWFLMENVPEAPAPETPGYTQIQRMHNNRDAGGIQNRERRFRFGWRSTAGPIPHFDIDFKPVPMAWEPAVCSTAGGRRASVALGGSGKSKGNQGREVSSRYRHRTLAHEMELQGLPVDFLDGSPLTVRGKLKAVGNGVPLPLGSAVAAGVRRALDGVQEGKNDDAA